MELRNEQPPSVVHPSRLSRICVRARESPHGCVCARAREREKPESLGTDQRPMPPEPKVSAELIGRRSKETATPYNAKRASSGCFFVFVHSEVFVCEWRAARRSPLFAFSSSSFAPGARVEDQCRSNNSIAPRGDGNHRSSLGGLRLQSIPVRVVQSDRAEISGHLDWFQLISYFKRVQVMPRLQVASGGRWSGFGVVPLCKQIISPFLLVDGHSFTSCGRREKGRRMGGSLRFQI